jgi:hypothetical protein
MSLLVDQTWVKEWEGKPTTFQKDLIVSWLIIQRREWYPLMKTFPPFCLVRAKKMLEVPCPYSIGIVRAYYDDGTVAVSQEPESEFTPVNTEDLEIVGFWKGLNQQAMKRLLS